MQWKFIIFYKPCARHLSFFTNHAPDICHFFKTIHWTFVVFLQTMQRTFVGFFTNHASDICWYFYKPCPDICRFLQTMQRTFVVFLQTMQRTFVIFLQTMQRTFIVFYKQCSGHLSVFLQTMRRTFVVFLQTMRWTFVVFFTNHIPAIDTHLVCKISIENISQNNRLLSIDEITANTGINLNLLLYLRLQTAFHTSQNMRRADRASDGSAISLLAFSF